ncbi:MAG: hypothetical protein QM784_09775 [Polyangiaceae bacterium]
MGWKILSLVTLLTCAGVTMGCGSNDGDDDDSAAHRQLACKKSCEAALGAKCPAEVDSALSDCEADCLAAFAASPECESKQFAYIECPGLQVSSGWECDAEDGASYPKLDVCTSEQVAYAACVQ